MPDINNIQQLMICSESWPHHTYRVDLCSTVSNLISQITVHTCTNSIHSIQFMDHPVDSDRSLIILIVPMRHPKQKIAKTRSFGNSGGRIRGARVALGDLLEERADITFSKTWSWPAAPKSPESWGFRVRTDDIIWQQWNTYIHTHNHTFPIISIHVFTI